jgi:hypothetical protein
MCFHRYSPGKFLMTITAFIETRDERMAFIKITNGGQKSNKRFSDMTLE